jgi:hypothetical protein
LLLHKLGTTKIPRLHPKIGQKGQVPVNQGNLIILILEIRQKIAPEAQIKHREITILKPVTVVLMAEDPQVLGGTLRSNPQTPEIPITGLWITERGPQTECQPQPEIPMRELLIQLYFSQITNELRIGVA